MTCTFQFFRTTQLYTLPNQWCCIIYISIQILNALCSSFYSWMIEKIYYYLAFQIIMRRPEKLEGRPTQFQTKESFEKQDFDEWIKAGEVCVNLRSITHNFGSAKLMNVSSIWVAVTWKGFGITSPFDNWRAVFLFFQFPSINIMYLLVY